MRAPDLARTVRRIGGVRALLFLGFALLGLRAAHLAVLEPLAKSRAARQGSTVLKIAPKRGEIYDRTNRKLAVSIDAPSVYAIPWEIKDKAATARALARVLRADASRIRKRLARGGNFVFLERWVSDERAERVLDLELPGISIVPEPRRVDPFDERASQILGFVNIDGRGVRGIEQQEDEWLRGSGLAYPTERDARGRHLAAPGVDPRATAGGDVKLTLDLAMQASAEAALSEAIERTQSRAGLVLTLDPRTGDILALAERPTFNPNQFREIPYRDTRARAFLDAFEPGSTLKVFLMAAALERGVVSLEDTFDCEQGKFRVPGKTIRDSHPYGVLDVTGVLRVSSNIGSAKIAYLLGAESHFEALRRFGFGSRTGSGFPDESAGLLRSHKAWRPVDHANIAFGQGISVTALQLAAAAAALADRGIWRTPRLVAARRTHMGEWIPARPAAARRAVSEETAAHVMRMMESVVGPEGTGRQAGLHGLRVAGKTGTAQKIDPETGRYTEDRYLAWFLGVAPADDPRVVVVVALDEPVGLHTGGAVAAPLFARVAAEQLSHFGIMTHPSPVRRAPPVAPPSEEMKRASTDGSLGVEDEG